MKIGNTTKNANPVSKEILLSLLVELLSNTGKYNLLLADKYSEYETNIIVIEEVN